MFCYQAAPIQGVHTSIPFRYRVSLPVLTDLIKGGDRFRHPFVATSGNEHKGGKMPLFRGLQILQYPTAGSSTPKVGKSDLSQEVATAARWGRKTLPRYFNGSVWGIRFRTPLYSGSPGELSTSADSCQHCRTLSENRTAIAVYRGVAKRDTLSVKLTGQPQIWHRIQGFIGLQGVQRHAAIFSRPAAKNRSDSRTAASLVMNIGSGLYPATNGHKNNAVRISYGDQEGDLYANHLLSRSG